MFGPAAPAPTVAQQMALADGTAASALGAVSAGPAMGPGGTVTVPLSSLQGFQRPAASARGRRSKGPAPLALKDNISLQTSHGGHAHGPDFLSSYAHAHQLGRERRDAAMDARSMAAALAQRGGRPR